MALVDCPQCGHKISPSAIACPSCGHGIAAGRKKSADANVAVGCGVVSLGVFGFMFWAMSEGGKIQDAEKTNPTCVSDYTKCSDNKEVIERHHSKDGVSLSVECKMKAQDSAKYGAELPWVSFGSYFLGSSYKNTGTAILIENDARFKNAFGAAEAVIAKCFYDLKSDQAAIEIVPK